MHPVKAGSLCQVAHHGMLAEMSEKIPIGAVGNARIEGYIALNNGFTAQNEGDRWAQNILRANRMLENLPFERPHSPLRKFQRAIAGLIDVITVTEHAIILGLFFEIPDGR